MRRADHQCGSRLPGTYDLRVPRVSVCIPVFNGAAYIGETLDSVLRQTMSDFDVVVVDNCSTDATCEIVESVGDSRVRLSVNEANIGPVGNWNRAVAACRSEVVKLVCADDILYRTCLERQIVHFESSSTVLAASLFDHITAAGILVRREIGLRGFAGVYERDEIVRRCVAKGQTLLGPPCAVMFRKDAHTAAGGFREDAHPIMDFDAWCRILEHGQCAVDPMSLGAFRLHGGSVSTEKGRAMGRKVRELLRAMDVEQSGHPTLAGRLGMLRSWLGDSSYLKHMRRSARA